MLERNEVGVRLEGRKTWALLTFLALASGPTSRRDLVDRLWSDADDPLGALRWALSQVRKAIAPEVDIDDGERGLILKGELSVDALELIEGRWDETTVGDLVRGELMEGSEFDDSPEFARWLDVQRARFGSAANEALRSCAALVARAEPDLALRLAERALKADPFDDAMHELVVDIHVARGDLARARSYVEATAARYRADLDVDAPAGLARALERSRASSDRLRPDTQARALLELADARAAGTGFNEATDLALRAAQAAAASGDAALEASALVLVVNYMTLCARGTPREWLALLHRALGLANAIGDKQILCDVEVERGRIAGMQGTYGASETALRRAIGIAHEFGDAGRVAYARRFLGIIETDRCDFIAAEADLRAGGGEAARSPELAMAWLARLLVKTARYDEAIEVADRAIEGMRKRTVMLQLPLALLMKADVAFIRGDRAEAMDLYGHAFGLADAQPDHDWCALALRGLARLDHLDGRPERARSTMRDALARVSGPHGYRWVEATILVDLLEWDGGSDQAHMQRALRLTRSAPMPDLAARLEALARSHTPAHTVPS
jgi:DNA-binding SARP family transcriptional activator